MGQPEQRERVEPQRPAAQPAASHEASPFHQQLQQERRPPAAESNPQGNARPAYQSTAPETSTTLPARNPVGYPQQGRGQPIETNPIQARPAPVESQYPGQGRYPGQGENPGRNGGEGYGGTGIGYGQFGPPREFRPPEGRGWGWQDPGRWSRGWDPFFFQQDPNYESWQPTINQESGSVASALNANDTPTAAAELNRDLWAMRGDIYGQNELLQEVQNQVSGEGAQLYLGQWDPTRGSWDDIRVQAQPAPEGYQPPPSYRMQTFE
jgi:hypothetical protein